jgi:hypothetical protein
MVREGFPALAEAGVEQAMIDYVAGLLRVYLAPTGGDDVALVNGLRQACERYESAKALIEGALSS